ncbi:MAG: hypothetical protein U9Q95_03445, partial [Candidatus Eisenbacteria bacterium]|nr:hypothetical protein [Candidatus Eisenbacteria bacterium]
GSLFVLHRVDAEGERACTRVVADGDAPPLTVRFTPRVPPGADVQEDGETIEVLLEPGGRVRFTVEKNDGAWETRLADADERSPCRDELP